MEIFRQGNFGLVSRFCFWLTLEQRMRRVTRMEMNDLPEISLNELALGDDRAWRTSYPVLYREIMITLRSRLRAGFGIDLEDQVVGIITDELMPGLRDRRTESFQKLRSFGELIAMAKHIAKRRAIDAMRRVSRRGEVPLPEDWDQLLGAEDTDDSDPDNEQFWNLVRVLKPPKPELFEDHFIGGMTYGEIAERRQMVLGTVCCHFKRGFDALRRLLISEPVDQPASTLRHE